MILFEADYTRFLTARFCTNSMPHPFAFFLANGWDATNLKVQIHTVRNLDVVRSAARLTTVKKPERMTGFGTLDGKRLNRRPLRKPFSEFILQG